VFGTTIEAGYDVVAPIYRQIEPFSDRRAGALSGGMKQKLALSCALIHRPDILFLDEPTTGVDAVSRREFWDLLEAMNASGLTIVVATPYMDEADRCDRVALIERGRILAIDQPAAIGARYPFPLFRVRARDRYALIQTLRAHPHAASVFPFGDTVHHGDRRVDMLPHAIADDLRAFAQRHGFADVQVTAIAPGIEDAFMALMGTPEDATV
jgi:ABC-type multidrug transport system ATPase subunit